MPTHERNPCAYCASRHKGICDGVSEAATVSVLEAARSAVRVYEAGDVIFAQGDRSTHVFNLTSGWIELHFDMADGRRQVTRFLRAGAVFGVESFGEYCSHTATAITTAVICSITTAKFHEMRLGIPAVNELFVSLLQRECQDAMKSLALVGLGNARERVGTLLWDLASTANGEDDGPIPSVIPIPLTQRHIGEATGLTSIHVNRTLRQLREEQVLEFRDGKLRILSESKLRRIAHRWPSYDATAPGGPPSPRKYQQSTEVAAY